MADKFDIIVAGGGIAGLTAGLTAARLGRRTLVLSGDVLGGHLLSIEKIDGVPGHPEGIPGFDLCPMTEEQAIEEGAEFVAEEARRIEPDGDGWKIATPDNVYDARAVIVATGTHLKSLGVPGEERLFGKGVSHCASCDAPMLRGQKAAVIGGGDSAMQEALTLAEHASQVVMLTHGDALRGQSYYRSRIEENPKIEIRTGVTVEEILGDAGVTGLRLRDSGGATADLEASGVFVFVGLAPNNACAGELLAFDPSGRIVTDESLRTGQKGIFAAGTIRAGSAGRAAAAAGEGATAAIAADRYLMDGVWPQG